MAVYLSKASQENTGLYNNSTDLVYMHSCKFYGTFGTHPPAESHLFSDRDHGNPQGFHS